MQEVEAYGPLFEHWLGLHPWDLERMTRREVASRLAWVKEHQRQIERAGAAFDG